MHPYPVFSNGAAGTSVTASGTSAETAIPNDSSGNTAKVVRITATGTAHVKPVLTGTAATANDILVQPGDAIFLHVQGFTHIAYIQRSTSPVITITPVED